jgi:hypothetical protein
LKYSPEPLSSAGDAERTIQEFGGLFRHVLNTTITADYVRVVPVTKRCHWNEWQWVISKSTDLGEPRPLQLKSQGWLLAEQRLGVRRSQRDNELWLTTLQYRYRWQTEEDDGTWLIRWDYLRGRAAHVHVNATPSGWRGSKDFHKLHVPTRRVAIEDIVRFLLAEGSVKRRSENWEETLEAATAIFDRIQARRTQDD